MSKNSPKRWTTGLRPGLELDPNNNDMQPSDAVNTNAGKLAKIAAVASPEKFAVPNILQEHPPMEGLSPKGSKTGKQFASGNESLSQDKILKSGSLFVRISDTTVDQERMAEFEKMEKGTDRMKLSNGNEMDNGENLAISQNQVNDRNVQSYDYKWDADGNNNETLAVPSRKNINPKRQDTPRKPSSIGSGGTPRNKESSTTNVVKPEKKSRSKTPTNRPRHVLTVELGRKVTPIRDKSPYACKIVQLPPDNSGGRPRSKSKKKVWVSQRDHQILEDQIQTREKEGSDGKNWLAANSPLFQEKYKQHRTPRDQSPTNSFTTTESIPLTQWPNFQSSPKASFPDQIPLVTNLPSTLTTSTKANPNQTCPLTLALPLDNGTPVSLASSSQKEENSNSPPILKEMADLVERGIFTASETCNVLINTVFKESLRNPISLERVMESKEFHAFLQSSNEISALQRGSEIMTACSQVINEYLDAIKTSGISIPSETNFARKSSNVACVATSKKNLTVAEAQKRYTKTESRVWSFVPPTATQEKFKLALYLNQETGEIMQTIYCQDYIFRMRYSISPIESQIRNIISASREQIGLPAFVKPESLLDTIVRSTSFALTRLIRAKTLISRSNKKLGELVEKIGKSKYAVRTRKLNELDYLRKKLQQLNICSGIIYQMSVEMNAACAKIRGGLCNSMHVLDSLQFNGVPGGSGGYNINSIVNKDGQVIPVPGQEKLPAHEAMIELTEGIRSIDSAIRVGLFSLETLGYGVKLGKGQKRLLKEYLEGIKTLGSEKDVDYGSLLMTIVCSTEMMNHFVDIVPSVDKCVRGAILVDLSKINCGTVELAGLVKRMMTDSRILAMKTTFKLRELKNRYKEEYGVNI